MHKVSSKVDKMWGTIKKKGTRQENVIFAHRDPHH